MSSLIWFGNNLRVADNSSLVKACSHDRVLAVFCFDPRWFQPGEFGFVKMGKFRARFLLASVKTLQEELMKLNISLLVYHERPEDCIPKLIAAHKVDVVYLQQEWTRDERAVLQNVKAQLEHPVRFEADYDQLLFHPEEVPYPTLSAIPNVFTAFRKKCEKYTEVRKPVAIPGAKSKDNCISPEPHLPDLKDLGSQPFEHDPRSAFPFGGGEREAKHRLDDYFWNTKKLAYYKRTRNGLVGTDYSSKFSPWLANGSISARTIYWEVRRFEAEIQKNQDTYWLIFELIWRDYFKYVSLKFGDSIFHLGGILGKDYRWNRDNTALEEWIQGTTNAPFVNANMIELSKTGWMSNRGRQNVASYWSKELEQDWRIGASYFESLLIDYDVHSNWGNWMYNSGVGNDPRDRKFNIKRQADMYDPQGTFQKKWLQQRLF